MITLHVSELKAQFSKVLAAVRAGERIGILYGDSREPVAMIVPFEPPDLPERDIGFLDGKVRIEFMEDFDMTEEELLGRWK
jgi:antitoxin (DNA-binding transcriptional repressor) of toxin-antitoxin stability system